MFVADQNATDRSQVKFFRCTNCIGAHVLSEPVSDNHYSSVQEDEFFQSSSNANRKHIQMV